MLLVPATGPIVEQAKRLSIEVFIMPYPKRLQVYDGILLKKRGLIKRIRDIIDMCKYNKQVYRLLRKEQIHIVCCNQLRSALKVGLSVKAARIPLIWYLRLNMESGIYKYIGLIISSKIIAITEGVKQLFSKSSLKAFSSKFALVSDGIDLESWNTTHTTFRHEMRISNEFFLIGMAGSFHPRKGHLYFIDAAREILKKCNNVIFVIVGGPNTEEEKSYFNHIKRIVANYEFRNRILFTAYRKDMKNVMAALDLFVLPSLIEGLGIVLLEAMAMCKPVIATKVGGPEEVVVHDRVGLLVPPANSKRLAKAMLDLIGDQDKCRRYGENGRQLVQERFEVNQTVKKFEAVLETLLYKKRAPSSAKSICSG